MNYKEIITKIENEKVENILLLLDELKLSDKQVARIFHYLEMQQIDITKAYRKDYSLLYEFLYHTSKKDKAYFHQHLIYPLAKLNIDKNLQEIIKHLQINTKHLSYLESGSSNFAFATEKYVIKLGNRRKTFDFPTFYRLNPLIVQKRFFYHEQPLYFEISPKCQKITLTEEDIHAINEDFQQAKLILGDPNYQHNFMLATTDTLPDFQEIDGIHEPLYQEESKAYQKKKIKLVDLDYIYHQNDKEITYAPRI